MSNLELILFQAFSLLAAAFSGLVVLSGLLFNVMLSSTRPFSHIIFFISLCDMIASIGNSFGFPPNGTFLCTTQSVLTMYFFPASWLWTVALVYQIYCVVIYKRLWLKLYAIHIICWSTSLILLLLPLSTSYYGVESAHSGKGICHIGGRPRPANNWFFVIFVAFLLVIFALITFLMLHMLSQINSDSLNDKHRKIVTVASLYPAAMFFSWFPKVLYFILIESGTAEFLAHPNEAVDIISTLYGVSLAIIFFSKSARVRTHWYNLLRNGKYTASLTNVTMFDDDEEILNDLNIMNNSSVEINSSIDGSTISVFHRINTTTEIRPSNIDN
eukprot:gene14651-19683_t